MTSSSFLTAPGGQLGALSAAPVLTARFKGGGDAVNVGKGLAEHFLLFGTTCSSK